MEALTESAFLHLCAFASRIICLLCYALRIPWNMNLSGIFGSYIENCYLLELLHHKLSRRALSFPCFFIDIDLIISCELKKISLMTMSSWKYSCYEQFISPKVYPPIVDCNCEFCPHWSMKKLYTMKEAKKPISGTLRLFQCTFSWKCRFTFAAWVCTRLDATSSLCWRCPMLYKVD